MSATPTGRRGSGELRGEVRDYLERANRVCTPTEIANALSCSSGAVANALDRLARTGVAMLVSDQPKKYMALGDDDLGSTQETDQSGAASQPTGPVPITRPNGQTYRPRDLAHQPDVEVLRRLRAHEMPALLYGPPGTGKTSVAEAAFSDLITFAGDGDTTVGDLVGEYTQSPGGTFEFVYGPLVRAMQEGRALLIDDATLISPAVLAVVYPAMDGRGEITITAHKGETITAQDGFYVVGGHNPGVHGAVLTEALSSRFAVHIEVTTDFTLASSLGVDPKAVRAAKVLARKCAAGEIGWSPQLRELLSWQQVAELLGTDAALGNLVGIAPAEDREAVAAVLQDTFGVPVAPLRLGGQL